ncbi:MAG: hypothetical protein ORN54_10890, partial [Cyclobacteriaceae bacterium]|nr:hypothetical protein [Cyclobacteriaceae bacterium]
MLNVRGRRIGRKIVVFESDDWGSIRIPSYKVFQRLLKKGLDVTANPFNRYDSLESADDLNALFELLEKFRDFKDNHPIITTNFIVANPDFAKIIINQFSKYHFETFLQTYQRHSPSLGCWPLIIEGQERKLIRPQFHGREHLNALLWLKLLRNQNLEALLAFEEGVFSIDIKSHSGKRDNLMATLDYNTDEEREFAYQQLREGMNIFTQIFGFGSRSFIAPCNVWDEGTEEVLANSGVSYIQSLRGQKIPRPTGYETKLLTMGGRSKFNQLYTVRNAYFEPSTIATYDW